MFPTGCQDNTYLPSGFECMDLVVKFIRVFCKNYWNTYMTGLCFLMGHCIILKDTYVDKDDLIIASNQIIGGNRDERWK